MEILRLHFRVHDALCEYAPDVFHSLPRAFAKHFAANRIVYDVGRNSSKIGSASPDAVKVDENGDVGAVCDADVQIFGGQHLRNADKRDEQKSIGEE
ncbi:MAG: hypothetical protein IKO40_11785 [Kiritimatiellae bacterium]|nr:hypothetical protein [Kiritimatiellia bacterium]